MTGKRNTMSKELRLLWKLHAIAQANPEMETIPLLERQHKTTKARDVFRKYQAALLAANILLHKTRCDVTMIHGMIAVVCEYTVIDLDTGYSITRASAGSAAMNMGWGANSAQTLALKQLLLELFQTTWDNEMEAAIERVDTVLQQKGVKATATDLIGAFFQDELTKPKPKTRRTK